MDRKLLKIVACYFIFLGLFLQSCAPTKTLVALKKEKISTLEKVGIISVYEPVGLPVGPLDPYYIFLKKQIDETKKVLLEASPAPKILEEFTARLTASLGIVPISLVSISEREPEVARIKETRRLAAKKDYYAFEKMNYQDYSSLKQRFGIDSLIVLQTYDNIRTINKFGGGSWLVLSLTTSAKLINFNNNELIWHKEINTMFKRNIGKQEIVRWQIPYYYISVDSFQRASYPQISYIVDELIKDFQGICIPKGSAETQHEQKDLTTEKLSQGQTQQQEASKDSGIISITSDPPDAKIFIDGAFKGQTPAEISLSPGTYQIFLQRQLYEPYKDSVIIEKGQTKTLNIKMSPEADEQR